MYYGKQPFSEIAGRPMTATDRRATIFAIAEIIDRENGQGAKGMDRTEDGAEDDSG